MILLHPVCTHSPEAVRRVERATGRVAVIVDGRAILITVRAAQRRHRRQTLRLV